MTVGETAYGLVARAFSSNSAACSAIICRLSLSRDLMCASSLCNCRGAREGACELERARIVGRGRNNDALVPASNESASAACLSLSTTSAPCVPPSEWLPAAAGRVSAVLPCRFRALSSSTSIPRAGRQAGLATARAYPREALRSREGTSSARTRLPPPQQRRGHRARPRKAPQRTMRSASRESTVQALQGLRLPRPTLLPSARPRHSQARRSQTQRSSGSPHSLRPRWQPRSPRNARWARGQEARRHPL